MDAAALPPILPAAAPRAPAGPSAGRDAGPGAFAAELQQASASAPPPAPAPGAGSSADAAPASDASARRPRGEPSTDPRRGSTGSPRTATAAPRTDASPDGPDDGTGDTVEGLTPGSGRRAPRLAAVDDETDAGPITDSALPVGPQPLPPAPDAAPAVPPGLVAQATPGIAAAANRAGAEPGAGEPAAIGALAGRADAVSADRADAPGRSGRLPLPREADDDAGRDAGPRTAETARASAEKGRAGRGDEALHAATDPAAEALRSGERSTGPQPGADAGAATPAPAAAPAPVQAFAAELSAAQGRATPGETTSPGAATELQLPVPVLSEAFAPRLGGAIAVLARDGIQEARVHLHPAELGPIAVQISVDGQAAQVHLAVDNALTRQLLESALPTLAGALRESGLTLTGGGVFERPRQDPGADAGSGGRGGGQADPSGRGRDGRDGEAEPRAAAPRARTVGALDLYA